MDLIERLIDEADGYGDGPVVVHDIEGLRALLREAAAALEAARKAVVSYPDDNPKTAVGATKVPLHLVPPVATHHMALAFKDGAAKYGPYNWREHRVSASVYYGAMLRHAGAWWDGEDLSTDALVHHLGHVMACCAILLDAAAVGKLNDDRPLPGGVALLQAEFSQGGSCRPPKPAECAVRCPERTVCDHCQWPDGPDREVQK